MNEEQLKQIPVWKQRQDSVSDQMADLRIVANRLGFYDAADAIKQLVKQLPDLKYGCHIEPWSCVNGLYDETCVLDTGSDCDCIYAKLGMRKEQCEYWRVISL